MEIFNSHKKLDKEERKTLFKYYTLNKNDLIKIPLDNLENIKKEILNKNDLFSKFIYDNFSSIKKNEYNIIQEEIINNIFNKIEVKVNEFIAYYFIPHLIYDLDNPLYDIKYEDKSLCSAVPLNTHLYVDLEDYNDLNSFLEVNYESQLRPFNHDLSKLTVYCLKQGYIESFDQFLSFFIEDEIKNVLLKYISKFNYLSLEKISLFDNIEGKKILTVFINKISKPYFENIVKLDIENLLTLFNFEENTKYIEFFKERAKNQKLHIKNYFNNNSILEEFVNLLSIKKLNISIGDINFDSNDLKFKENLLDHLIYLLFYNKSFSFIIKEETNIEKTILCSGFLYLDRKEIIFFEKEDFKEYFEKNKNSKLISRAFEYKEILEKLVFS